ncbi:MAG: YbjN domain-containing protein [Fimbriimonadaceae bacterium]
MRWLLSAALMVASMMAMAQQVITSISTDEVKGHLADMDIEAEINDNRVEWTDGNTTMAVVVFAEDDNRGKDVMLQATREGRGSIAAAQEWNLMNRIGHVYYMEGTANYEFDVDLQDGITVGNFKSCISRWIEQSDTALSAVLSGGGSSGGGDGDVITDLDMQMVVDALADMGFEATEDEDGDLTFAKDEIIYNFIRYDEGDFMIQAELTGNTTVEAINDWNAASRFGRAYLSPEDNSVYVELDINIQGGGTWENVVNHIKRFLKDTVPDVQNAVFDQGMRRAG